MNYFEYQYYHNFDLLTSQTSYFFQGPKIPFGCYGGSMATLPDGTEAVLVGCEDFFPSYFGYHGTGSILLLTWQGEHLEWVKFPQFLKHTRTKAVAMLLPDSMTDCTAKCK